MHNKEFTTFSYVFRIVLNNLYSIWSEDTRHLLFFHFPLSSSWLIIFPSQVKKLPSLFFFITFNVPTFMAFTTLKIKPFLETLLRLEISFSPSSLFYKSIVDEISSDTTPSSKLFFLTINSFLFRALPLKSELLFILFFDANAPSKKHASKHLLTHQLYHRLTNLFY